MKAVSLFAGIGGFDLALERAGINTTATVEYDKHARGVLQHHYPNTTHLTDITKVTADDIRATGYNGAHGILTGGFPASPTASRVTDAAWEAMNGANCGGTCTDLLQDSSPDGWSVRTCPACCPVTTAKTLKPSSLRWLNSGTASPGGYSTHATSESPNDAVECSLSQVLETGPIPAKYYLSQKAAAGILRRAGKRGKTLPAPLAAALEAVAGHQTPTA